MAELISDEDRALCREIADLGVGTLGESYDVGQQRLQALLDTLDATEDGLREFAKYRYLWSQWNHLTVEDLDAAIALVAERADEPWEPHWTRVAGFIPTPEVCGVECRTPSECAENRVCALASPSTESCPGYKGNWPYEPCQNCGRPGMFSEHISFVPPPHQAPTESRDDG